MRCLGSSMRHGMTHAVALLVWVASVYAGHQGSSMEAWRQGSVRAASVKAGEVEESDDGEVGVWSVMPRPWIRSKGRRLIGGGCGDEGGAVRAPTSYRGRACSVGGAVTAWVVSVAVVSSLLHGMKPVRWPRFPTTSTRHGTAVHTNTGTLHCLCFSLHKDRVIASRSTIHDMLHYRGRAPCRVPVSCLCW